MSNAFAIQAVTSAITHLLGVQLADVLNGGPVTSRPLDKAREAASLTNQLNVFLYAVSTNVALRNQDMPGVRAGETAPVPLGLDLHYVLTAYGSDDDHTDPLSHTLLGHAMRVLHDHAIIAREDLSAGLPASDIAQQIERIKITPEALSVEEVSKLWTIFQAPYRVSTGYQVSVVLIESTRATRTPPPVLRRGQDDRGVAAFPSSSSPLPALRALELVPGQRDARLGDRLTLQGNALDAANGVRLANPRLGFEVLRPLETGASASTVAFTVNDDAMLWAAGLYSVAVEMQRPGEAFTRTTNALALALIPSLSALAPTSGTADSSFTLSLTIKPAARPGQRVSVLVGDSEIAVPEVSAATNHLSITVPALPAGKHIVRVRVDGVDSSPIISAGSPALLQFDPSQTLTLT